MNGSNSFSFRISSSARREISLKSPLSGGISMSEMKLMMPYAFFVSHILNACSPLRRVRVVWTMSAPSRHFSRSVGISSGGSCRSQSM